MAKDEMDREANYFARCLLMPRKFVLADLAALNGIDFCEDKKMQKLAKRYSVSVSLMALRIYELTHKKGR